MEPAWSILRKAAGNLPDVDESTSYGTPALKLKGKLLARVKDGETIVLMMPVDEKMALMEAAPEIYFETDHYWGWAAVLVRASAIDLAELTGRLKNGWRQRATKTLLKAHPEI